MKRWYAIHTFSGQENNIKKHIEQTYIVDNNDKTRRWKYPQCFFTDDVFRIGNTAQSPPNGLAAHLHHQLCAVLP